MARHNDALKLEWILFFVFVFSVSAMVIMVALHALYIRNLKTWPFGVAWVLKVKINHLTIM